MKSIKFSHIYKKMGDLPTYPKTAILMECFKADSREFHPRFVEYDTLFYDKDNKLCFYKLPEGEVIILLLKSYVWSEDACDTVPFVWTTIRRFTPEKWEYYRKCRWEEFEMKIEVEE